MTTYESSDQGQRDIEILETELRNRIGNDPDNIQVGRYELQSIVSDPQSAIQSIAMKIIDHDSQQAELFGDIKTNEFQLDQINQMITSANGRFRQISATVNSISQQRRESQEKISSLKTVINVLESRPEITLNPEIEDGGIGLTASDLNQLLGDTISKLYGTPEIVREDGASGQAHQDYFRSLLQKGK